MNIWASSGLQLVPKKGLYSSLIVGFNFVGTEEKILDLWGYKRSPLCLANLKFSLSIRIVMKTKKRHPSHIQSQVLLWAVRSNSIIIIGGVGSTAVGHRVKTKAFDLLFPIGKKKVMPDAHLTFKAESASRSSWRFPVRFYHFCRSLGHLLLPQPFPLPIHQRGGSAVTIEPALRSLSQSSRYTRTHIYVVSIWFLFLRRERNSCRG